MRSLFNQSPVMLGVLVVSLVGCEARDCEKTKKVEYTAEAEKSEKEDGACLEFVTTKTWFGETEQVTGDYESGKNVLVDSANGSVVVKVTDRDDVRATFKPFVARAHDLCDDEPLTMGDRCQEIDDNLAEQELIFEAEDGHYLIQSQRHDAVASLGAEITVELPSSFNGRLTVAQNNGSTDVDAHGDAAAVIVESQNGTCEIDTGAPYIDINCKNGSTNVDINAIASGDGLRQIFKDDGHLGDMVIQFPSTDEPFAVSARSVGEAITIEPANPMGCEVTGTDPRSVTLLCNGATNEDPVYEIKSDESLSEITLAF